MNVGFFVVRLCEKSRQNKNESYFALMDLDEADDNRTKMSWGYMVYEKGIGQHYTGSPRVTTDTYFCKKTNNYFLQEN